MTSTVDIDTRLNEMPINDIKLVECEISDTLRKQGVIPAVKARLTDESKLAIKSLIREVAEEVIATNFTLDVMSIKDEPSIGNIIFNAKNQIEEQQRTKLNKILKESK